MKTHLRALLVLFCVSTLSVFAADLTGIWTTEFDSQIGVQKYTFTFKSESDQLVGSAAFEHSYGKGTVDLQNVKVEGDQVSFTETFKMDGMEIEISYAGTLTADEMKLDRHVGDFATEHITAKRAAAE